jgi:hypothetical protein
MPVFLFGPGLGWVGCASGRVRDGYGFGRTVIAYLAERL